ncbi:MAG: 16S rRNA (cytidine(1402)-2'-O)-methyltransferase [Methylobacteriaceae bacterium]|nr:16S rRNA (cytidine(1402)-2'-O)-methyltransferase [Methylobacteriaceae bacterium]
MSAAPAERAFTIAGARIPAAPIAPGLHVVATPIGHLGDVTLRALATLAAADLVVAEDTRVTKTLLAHYGVATPLVAYHEHNAAQMRPQLLARLARGERLALVSDAGTPLVSDPGFRLVGEALAQGAAVTPLPGACAALAGLVVAGLPTDRFYFEGFLPERGAARRRRLAELATIPATLIFYESPRRIAACLADCAAVLGDRPAAAARELTKRFEETRRGGLAALAAAYAQEGEPRGEFVLLVGPPEADAAALSEAAVDARLTAALARHSAKDAAAIVAGETGLPRRQVYARAIALTRPSGEAP